MAIQSNSQLKRLYTRLLFTFTLTVTLLILGLSTLLYRNYTSASIDRINQTGTSMLQQISYSANYMDNVAQKFMSIAAAEPSIANLFFNPDEDMVQIGNAFRFLNLLVTTNDYIYSAYTISLPLDRIISTENGAFYSVQNFYDTAAVDLVKKWHESMAAIPIARTIQNAGSGGVNVYTYIMPYQSRFDVHPQTALVVNINASVLRNLISSLNTKDTDYNSDIFVIDENGIVVNHTLKEMFRRDMKGTSYTRSVLESTLSSGSFKTSIEGKPFNVTFVSSDKLKWKFISLTAYDAFLSPVKTLKSSTLLISAIVLLLGLIFSLLMSRSLYSPVRKMIDSIRLRNDELVRKQRDQRHTLKDDWLKQVILGNKSYGEQELEAQRSELGIRAGLAGTVRMVLFRIDGFRSFVESYSKRDRNLLKFAIANMIEDLSLGAYSGDVIDLDNDKLVLLLDSDGSDGEETMLTELSRNLQSSVTSYLRLSVSAFIGRPVVSAHFLGEAYLELQELSMYRLVAGKGSVLTPEYLSGIELNQPSFPDNKAKLLLDSLKLGHLEKATGYFDEIMAVLVRSRYETILSSVMHLMFMIRSSFPSVADSERSRVQDLLQGFFVNMESIESLEEIQRNFEEIFQSIVASLDTNKQNKRHMIVSRIKQIIAEQYRDPNLNLSLLAEEFQMSHVYLGRIFKESTGQSVVEHITSVRMEHVKRLLDETSMTTREIVEQCGWEDSNYFYILFKKHFGIPLSQYRLMRKSEDK
ncbi:AraC family transcriptional regulator [Paenibacillus albus]|uniref:AraC family transcriptional regulator n=1 Tax=Paenibacillus albus TaxID=2495582 RepID=A0A3S9ABS8_9BACL|nr:AraC family transcriptional regulator [Paenibacillus albus]AZN43155.1 AraC family transcriptional regulator [Paenibacillus albus]